MANETERLKRIDDDLSGVEDTQNQQSIRQTVVNTTTTTKDATVVLFQLDATGGSMSDIVVEFFLDDDGAATFTPSISKTRADALSTFVTESIPAIADITTPAADARYRYLCGDLGEDQQMRFSIAQDNAGDATNACDAMMKYTED